MKQTNAKDFIYSVRLLRHEAEAKSASIQFGKVGESYFALTLDFENGHVAFGNETLPIIKSCDYGFDFDVEYEVSLVVNDGVAKLYIGGTDSALLVLDLGASYVGGEFEDNLGATLFSYAKASFMSLNSLSGDLFIGGYGLYEVVNLTDGNVRLEWDDFSLDQGVLTIEEDYLGTLETATEYKFRAVTSFTDFDFYVSTQEVGVEVAPAVEKYYRGDDVVFELSQAASVYQAYIDKELYPFTLNQEQTLVRIAHEDLVDLPSGEHQIKLFTDAGRPEAKFSLYSTVEVIPELPAPVSHTYFFIDIAIFAVLILGYVGFSIASKRKKQQ